MEDLQTVNLLNGCEDIDDPLDLMDHCDTESLGSDVWKGSDSEDETYENREGPSENLEKNINIDENCQTEKNEKDDEKKEESSQKEYIQAENEENKNAETSHQSAEVKEAELSNETETEDKEKQHDNQQKPVDSDINKDKESVAQTDTEEKITENKEVTNKDPLAFDGQGIIEDSQMEYNDDGDDDDDFDPSLLCPEVSMAVDENPVITSTGVPPCDSSPLPYEPGFATFTDEVTGAEISFNLSEEEHELRKKMYGPTNPIQYTKIHCTACNVHLGSALGGQSNRFVHPLLKVIICEECYHFYTSGEFEKDEDGSELYCRWCGQGGQVLCCSKCEFVFCKRCIRTNFGRKKMFEIRDSDSWDCFRCAPEQLTTHRVACYEFFEYVRRHMAQASTTLQGTDVWNKDYTRCCSAKKRPTAENGTDELKKPKRRREVDPLYTPMIDLKPPNNNMAARVVPRLHKDNDIEFVRAIPAPQVTLQTLKTNNNLAAFRTILPKTVQTSTVFRLNSQTLPSLAAAGSRLFGAATTAQRHNSSSTALMKHEWFEKTVRAAARVNSHLSYTLTQLNKAQSQAASVEELAVVHNKLQEILSSSINSLIQIRKNLRTEFIAGIKTVRLPSKKATETYNNNDDDVIFVSAPTTTMPMPSLPSCVSKSSEPIVIVDNSTTTTEKPRLKVKSVMELQNVPSECITIPDDVPQVVEERTAEEVGKKNEQEEKKLPELEKDSTSCTSNAPTPEKDTLAPGDSPKRDKKMKKLKWAENLTEEIIEPQTKKSKIDSNIVYNVKDEPSKEIKKMLSVRVNLLKVNLEELQKQLPNECH